MVPSPERFPSPRLHFATINAKSAAALEAVFGRDFDVTDHLGVQLIKVLSHATTLTLFMSSNFK